MKLAIISSASETYPDSVNSVVTGVIENLTTNDVILTGGCLGIPGLFTKLAKNSNIKTVAYSPDSNSDLHNKRYDNLHTDYFDSIKFIPGFTARSLQMIHDADAVVLLNGRIGTLSEFTIALEEGKYVGVVTETGGIADRLEYILSVAQKEFPGKVFFSSNTQEVMSWLKQKSEQ
jgi:uncharacterized protein (TIGR00725 family)